MKTILTAVILCISAFGARPILAQTPFFADKTINVVLGGPPAGSADLRTRSVINVLRKHIPGNPNIIVQSMAAGGGRQAANHVFKVAKPDGLTIGSMGAALVANAVLGEPGVQYDIDKFIYLGTPDSAQHYLFITHRDSGFGNLEKLRAAPSVRIGSQSVGHPVYITGRTFAYFMGVTNSKFVTGYTGPELDLAITRREVDGRVTTGETMLVRSRGGSTKDSWTSTRASRFPRGKRINASLNYRNWRVLPRPSGRKNCWKCSAPSGWQGRIFSCRPVRLKIARRFFRMRCARL